jgi:hypothetical protein
MHPRRFAGGLEIMPIHRPDQVFAVAHVAARRSRVHRGLPFGLATSGRRIRPS